MQRHLSTGSALISTLLALHRHAPAPNGASRGDAGAPARDEAGAPARDALGAPARDDVPGRGDSDSPLPRHRRTRSRSGHDAAGLIRIMAPVSAGMVE
jgi:hypothetical protein